jgi:AcrR family transcriptional regulator
VAGHAGVATGTVYLYVTDRDELLAALFRRRLDGLLRDLDATLTTDTLLDEGLESLLARALEVVIDHYARHAATFRTAVAQLPASDRLRGVYWQAHRGTEERLVAFLRRAQEAGKVRAAEPRTLAHTLLVIVQGANHPLLTGDPASAEARAIRDELRRALVHLLAPGR